MSAIHELSRVGVVEQLVRFAVMGFDGWVAFRPSEDEVHSTWGFVDGRIVDLGCAGEESFLTTTLLSSNELREKDRKRARKQAHATGRDPGEIVLEMGVLTDAEISERLLHGVQLQLAQVLGYEELVVEVQAGPLAQAFGIAQVLQIDLSTEEMLAGAAQIAGDWSLVSGDLPALKDVYYATPQSFGYVQAHDQFPNEIAMINVLDGERDLAEAIEACGIDPFAAFEAVNGLHNEGALALINPVQLFQQGCDLEKSGQKERGLRRLERAEERGLDDFDLGFKLAELYRELGQTDRAIECYLSFAEKCATQFRIEDTIRACSQIIEIDPDNLTIQDRYLSLLSKYAKSEEAVSHGLRLARKFADDGRDAQARTTLEHVIGEAGDNEEVLRLYLELCEHTGHETGVSKARRSLADLFHQREETDKALELYQNLFVQGEESLEMRARLAELHTQRGNPDIARDHLQMLRRYEGWAPRNPAPDALAYFRRLNDIPHCDPSVTSWLIDESKNRGAREETAKYLAQHRDRLEETGDLKGARKSAERLAKLNPLDLEATRTLAELERKTGDSTMAAATMQKLAVQLAENNAPVEERRQVLEELVRLDPVSLVGRRLLLELSADDEPSPERHAVLVETSLLELLSGNVTSAVKDMTETSDDSNSLGVYFTFLAGRIRQLKSDQAGALECFHRCADAAILRKDQCLLRDTLLELEALTPGDPELDRYRDQLEQFAVVETTSRPTERVVQGSVQNITAKLKNLQTPGGDSGGEEAAEPEEPSPRKTNKIQAGPLNAVARLKALQGGAETSSEAPPESDAVAPPPPTKVKLSGADKLKALRKKKSEAATQPLPALDALADAESDNPGASEPTDSPSEEAKIERPAPKSTKKLGGAANKLSALRQPAD